MEDHGELTKPCRWNKQKDDSKKYIEEEKRDIFVYLPMAFRKSRLIRSCCFHHVVLFWGRKVIGLPRSNVNCFWFLFLYQTKKGVLLCTIDYGKIDASPHTTSYYFSFGRNDYWAPKAQFFSIAVENVSLQRSTADSHSKMLIWERLGRGRNIHGRKRIKTLAKFLDTLAREDVQESLKL